MNIEPQKSLTEQVCEIVLAAAGGDISREELDKVEGSLRALGYSSLAYMTLISRLEKTFGVVIDPEDEPDFLFAIPTIVDFIARQRNPGSGVQ